LHAEAPDGLDGLGRVIDFGVLKSKFAPWVEDNWDHGMIIYDGDNEMREIFKAIPNQKVFLLPENPTAENMAKYILEVVAPQLLADTMVHLSRVVLWETENCYVEVCADDSLVNK